MAFKTKHEIGQGGINASSDYDPSRSLNSGRRLNGPRKMTPEDEIAYKNALIKGDMETVIRLSAQYSRGNK